MTRTKTIRDERESLRRRKINYLKRGYELSKTFGVDIYVIIKQNGRYTTFNSNSTATWIPTEDEMVSNIQTKFLFKFEIDSQSKTHLKSQGLATEKVPKDYPMPLTRTIHFDKSWRDQLKMDQKNIAGEIDIGASGDGNKVETEKPIPNMAII